MLEYQVWGIFTGAVSDMYYSSIGILALIIHFIINFNILFKRADDGTIPAVRPYRYFLLSVAVYYTADISWGFLYDLHINILSSAATNYYFIAMGLSSFFWIRYIARYLNKNYRTRKFFYGISSLFIFIQLTILFANLFKPIAFWFEDDGSYHTSHARSVTEFLHMSLFAITAVNMFIITLRSNSEERRRSLMVCLFSVTMSIFVILQTLYPLMPFYAIGLHIGTNLLHTFVLEDEKESRRKLMENLIQIEQLQQEELGSVRHLAYTDSLTGLKNKHAYIEDIGKLEKRIEEGTLADFAFAIFDINNLKEINDTLGHIAGDQYIKDAGRFICESFHHSPVYRIGGDEFAALLLGEDCKNRHSIIKNFNRQMENNRSNEPVISCGVAVYHPENDKTLFNIFERADRKMYERKKQLKMKPGKIKSKA